MGTQVIDPRGHVGEVHGIYKIVDVLDEKDKYGHWVYKGVCIECGYEKFTQYGNFSGEKSRATECKHIRKSGDYVPYGHEWTNQRLGRIFKTMIARCYNKNNKDYRWYGGNGVRVYREWLLDPISFEKWAMSNGYSDDLTIDRIDPTKDYCPENCQWIPLSENSRKAGSVNWITVQDATLTGRQWSSKLGIGTNTINQYVKRYGINKTQELIAAMLSSPPETTKPKSHQTWFSMYGIQV